MAKSSNPLRRALESLGVAGLLVGLALGGKWVSARSVRVHAQAPAGAAGAPAAPGALPQESAGVASDLELLREAFLDRRSGVTVQGSGTVVRTLADDVDGSRHQRFVLRVADGFTLLFAHNLDVAPRVPLEPGSEVGFRGRYEWNEQGGVVHWTHHDPRGRQPGGWLEHDGRRYE